jgi:hypothetical protein
VLANAPRDQVILMHDIHEPTVDGARAIFRGLKKKGFTLVTVSELYRRYEPAATTRCTRAEATRRSSTTRRAEETKRVRVPGELQDRLKRIPRGTWKRDVPAYGRTSRWGEPSWVAGNGETDVPADWLLVPADARLDR